MIGEQPRQEQYAEHEYEKAERVDQSAVLLRHTDDGQRGAHREQDRQNQRVPVLRQLPMVDDVEDHEHGLGYDENGVDDDEQDVDLLGQREVSRPPIVRVFHGGYCLW